MNRNFYIKGSPCCDHRDEHKLRGSITPDEDLMDVVKIIENGKEQAVNVNNGSRIETYINKGKHNSGIGCLNGMAASEVAIGDIVIVISYTSMEFEEAKGFQPGIIFPREGNKI